MFEETLEFENDIIICYCKQKFVTLQEWVPNAQMWAIVEVVTFTLNHVVLIYVVNQLRAIGCYWMLLEQLLHLL